jgi:hypothetical protein
MKLGKSKSLIGLAVALALLVGTAYLFLQVTGAQQPKSPKAETPSTAATPTEAPSIIATSPTPPEEPEKPPPPEHQFPSVVLISPGTPHEKLEPAELPEHQLPSLVVSRPAMTKEAVHEESEVPLYEGPTLATGDDCSDPIVVNLPGDLPYSDLNQYTCGRNNDYTETCLSGYDGGEDIIYELTVTTAVDVDITMDPKGTAWTGMAIDNACPPGDPCMDYDTGSSGIRTLTGVHLEPGTYYIMIDTWPSPDCIPDFDLTITEAVPPPPNDSCQNATAVGDVTDLAFSTTLASFDGDGTCMSSPNIWYCYTATCTGDATVSLCGSSYDTKLAVYEGCECDPLGTEIDCNDDCCGVQSQITFAAVSGNEYLIEVGGYSSNTGDGILTISCRTPGPPPANDECVDAIAISPPDCPDVLNVSGTTEDATVDCPEVLDWEAVWYEFELTYAYNKVYIDYCPTNDQTAETRGVVLYSQCPVDSQTCEDYLILYTDYSWVTCPSGFTDLTVWWENLPAGTYYLPVYALDCNDYPMDFSFDICVEEMAGPQPGDNCDNPIVASLNKGEGDTLYMDLGDSTCGRGDYYSETCLGSYDGGEDIIYELTVNTAVRVNITLDPKTTTWTGIAIDDVCPPGATCMAYSTNSSASPHGITNLDLAPGVYYIIIDTYPSPDCIDSFDLVITEVGVGPPNDDCEDAITVYPPDCPDEQVVDGTTIGAGIDCPGFLDWPAVWYTFELTYECNDLFIDFCEMDFDLSSVGAVIYNECPVVCDDPIYMTEGAFVDCPNGTYNAQIWYKNLPPGQYWLPIYVKDLNDNEYLDFSFGICVEECVPLGPGNTCEDPKVVSLNKAAPGDTLYADYGQTTCGRFDDYDATCLGYYDGGEDMIYEVNVSTAVDVDIKMDPKGTTYGGVAIDAVCPPGDPCMAFASGYSGPYTIFGVHLDPGTYYIMVDTWPSPDCIPDFDLFIIESEGITAGNNCGDPVLVTLPADMPYSDVNHTCARVNDYENTCLGYYDGGEDIIYEVTVTEPVNVSVTLDPKTSTWSGIALDASCPPGDPCMYFSTNSGASPHGFNASLSAGTYYIMIDTWPSPDCIPEFELVIDTAAAAPENDTCQGAPISDTFPDTLFGTTVGATIDCPGVLDWDAVWYRFDVPYATNNIKVNFCPTEDYIATIGIVLYDECPPDCPGYIVATGYQWVYCENTGLDNPEIWWDDMPGPASYWFPVYVIPGKKAPMDFGFEVMVEEAVPCTVVCPEGAIAEGEPDCYDGYVDNYNGGCNSSPYIWQDINCGDTICGTSGVYDDLYYRDTDWFRVKVGDGDLTWTCVAEFPLLIFVIDAGSENCVDYTILGSLVVPKCDTASLSFYVTAGVYWLLVMPSDWLPTIPCGDQSEYVAWAECTPFGPQMAVDPASMYPVLNPTGECSTATEDLSISSVGGEDLTYDITENPPVDWMELSSYSGTLPPDETDIIEVSFDAGGMAEGDYDCDLEITHNDPGLPDPYVVAVHLEVELAPEIDMAPRVWMPVIPGCMMDQGFRVHNYGEGELRFEVSVTQNPPPLMAGKNNVREALESLRQAGKANPSLTPKEAFRTIGAKKSAIEYHSTGPAEGLLFSAGAGKQANILLVDDDGGLPGGSYYDIEDIFMDALDANGFVYDYYVVDWTDPESPGPDLATMEQYGCVIWFTGETWGYYGDDTFTPTDEANVGAYLDGGGNLFLSAQDYLWDMYPSAGSFSPGQFPYDYLGLQSVVQDVINDPYTAVGLAGSVAEGMQFDCLRFTDNPDVPLWTDDLTGLAGVVDVFDAAGYISAVQYDGGTFKTVFTTTAFPGLVDGSPSYRAELMASIMEWLGCVGPACPFTVYPEEGDIPAESFFDVFLTFDGTLFENCVDDTQTCYMVFTSNDCDEPVVSVPVHAMSARGDVTGDCVINIGDVVFLLNYVFCENGPPPDPMCIGDVDRDGDVDSDDALYLVSYLFTGGPPPEIPTAPMEEQTPIQLK